VQGFVANNPQLDGEGFQRPKRYLEQDRNRLAG